MSSNAPIERLNYFNGQRLEAADFRLEQDFHIRVRRELNKRLFTAGIAGGLTVEKVMPEPSHTVAVLPGLALDSEGREIILVDPKEVPVAGKPTKPGEPVTGNYLVIEYAEEKIATVSHGCAVRIGVTCKATEDLKWGDLSRIRAEPRLFIQHPWPKPGDNKIVLAQLELNDDCSIRDIRKFVRREVAAARPVATRAIALEGEKDLDKDNPKDLYFHVASSAPASASLFLRGLKFSTLFYTELGQHQHGLDLPTGPGGAIPDHFHTIELGELATTEDGAHRHLITGSVEDAGSNHGIEFDPADADDVPLTGPNGERGGQAIMEVHESGKHTHKLAGGSKDTKVAGAQPAHTHAINGTTNNSGQTQAARAGAAPLDWINTLKVELDGNDITPEILQQLNDRDGAGIWPTLGKGTGAADDKLNAADVTGKVVGTGEIDLLRAGVDLSPAVHRMRFSVAAGGGRIQFNLYLE